MVFTAIADDIEKVDAREGGVLSLTADAETIAGQVVKLTGNNSVSPSDTDGEQVIGVATQGVPSGDSVTVLSNSTVANVRANAEVTAGSFVTSHGATGEEGEVITADGTGDYVLGIALETIGAGEYGQILVDLGGQVN